MAGIFTVGEKVFAKMRGYPAWPARIECIADSTPSNMKYHVLFYGTLQRGICKRCELFPYLENKAKFRKPTKAKGFKEALEQIEGLAPVPQLVPKIKNEKYKNGIYKEAKSIALKCSKMNNKIYNSSVIGEKEVKRNEKVIQKTYDKSLAIVENGGSILNSSSKSTQKTLKQYTNVKRKLKTYIINDNVTISVDANKDIHISQDDKNCCEESPSSKTIQKELGTNIVHRESVPSGPVLINGTHKLSIVSYNQSIPESNPCTSNCQEKQSMPSQNRLGTVSRSGRVIKRKSFHDEIQESSFSKTRRIIRHSEGKECVQGVLSQNISSAPSQGVQRESNEAGSLRREATERKPTARELLATENCLTHLDTLIRAQLGVSRANPHLCLQFLDDMYDLHLQPLMLKKHPEVVETIKRLRKYVGNAGAWNYSDMEKKAFEEQASRVRKKAEYIFDKFKVMFAASDSRTFLETFADSVVEFQAKTQGWPLHKIYALVSEPKTRAPKSPRAAKILANEAKTPSREVAKIMTSVVNISGTDQTMKKGSVTTKVIDKVTPKSTYTKNRATKITNNKKNKRRTAETGDNEKRRKKVSVIEKIEKKKTQDSARNTRVKERTKIKDHVQGPRKEIALDQTAHN